MKILMGILERLTAKRENARITNITKTNKNN